MKIHIFTNGDPSVGIPGTCITIDWPDLENFIDDDDGVLRGLLKRELQILFGEWLDERPTVTLADECGDCGARLVDGKCPTHSQEVCHEEPSAEANSQTQGYFDLIRSCGK